MPSCLGKRKVQVDDDSIYKRIQVIHSEYIDQDKLNSYSNGRISTLLDLHWYERIVHRKGRENKLENDHEYFTNNVLDGIPTNLKKRYLLSNYPGLRNAFKDAKHVYEAHTNDNLNSDSLTMGDHGGDTSLGFCPTLSEGFLGITEERGCRPVPMNKIANPGLNTHTLLSSNTYNNPLELSSTPPIPMAEKATEISVRITEPTNMAPSMNGVEFGAIPSRGSPVPSFLNALDSRATDGGFTMRPTMSMQDVLAGDLPHIGQFSSGTHLQKGAPGAGQYLSWLDLSERPTTSAVTGSAFFSTTNLLSKNVQYQPGTFHSPVGIVHPPCKKKLLGMTYRFRSQNHSPIIRPQADNCNPLLSNHAPFFSGPPKPVVSHDRRYAVEGTTDWSQIVTANGLAELRRQLWCFYNSLKNVEFCPSITMLQICLFSWGFLPEEAFVLCQMMLSQNRSKNESIPQVDWITKKKDFVLHVQYCKSTLRHWCPDVDKHLSSLGFDLAAWMARHLQALLGRLLPWRILDHLIYCTIVKGMIVPVGYLLTIICGLEGALLKCSSLEEAGDLLGANYSIIMNWHIHIFGETDIDDDMLALTYIRVANRFISKLKPYSFDTALQMSCGFKVTPYLTEIRETRVHRVAFTSRDDAPPNCILDFNEWGGMWHSLHALYQSCIPQRFFNMEKQGNTIGGINKSIADWNNDHTSKKERISRFSCCLVVMSMVDPECNSTFKIAILSPQNPFVPKIFGQTVPQAATEGDVTAFYHFKEGHTFMSTWAYDHEPMTLLQDAFEKDKSALSVGDALVIPYEFGRRGIIVAGGKTVFGYLGADLDDPIHLGLGSPGVAGTHKNCKLLSLELWTF